MDKESNIRIVNFTKDKLKDFKKLYNTTVKENKKQFIFEGNLYLTGYAKYLIEYLEQ